MAEGIALLATTKAERYAEALPQLEALVADEPDLIANLANITAVLRTCLPIASWVGFYIARSAFGRGVCGTAAAERRTVIVPDVDQFPGHIACDAGSKSEIVVPIAVGD